VHSQVWDLYGSPDEPVVGESTLCYGASLKSAGSHATYQRVNLRSLTAEELLTRAPATLWPLVALTRDGAREEVVRQARDAIESRSELGAVARADHLAVLWFVAEAEEVPTRVLKAYISEERLMESELYRNIFERGEAKGEAIGEARGEARGEVKGEARARADTVIRILTHRLGLLDPAVRERIRSLSDPETLATWYEAALQITERQAAEQLVEKIRATSLP
jgi:hypothetical protein